jgi:hypothetical protein
LLDRRNDQEILQKTNSLGNKYSLPHGFNPFGILGAATTKVPCGPVDRILLLDRKISLFAYIKVT